LHFFSYHFTQLEITVPQVQDTKIQDLTKNIQDRVTELEGLQWRQRAGEQAARRLERSLWKRWTPQAFAGSESAKFWRFATISRAVISRVLCLRLPVCSVRKVRRVAAVAFAHRRLFGQISVDCMLVKKLADC
jgi:hypothetical protein